MSFVADSSRKIRIDKIWQYGCHCWPLFEQIESGQKVYCSELKHKEEVRKWVTTSRSVAGKEKIKIISKGEYEIEKIMFNGRDYIWRTSREKQITQERNINQVMSTRRWKKSKMKAQIVILLIRKDSSSVRQGKKKKGWAQPQSHW